MNFPIGDIFINFANLWFSLGGEALSSPFLYFHFVDFYPLINVPFDYFVQKRRLHELHFSQTTAIGSSTTSIIVDELN